MTNPPLASITPSQSDVLGIILRRHDLLCGLLVDEMQKLKGPAATADAQLTVLANWIEDQVGVI